MIKRMVMATLLILIFSACTKNEPVIEKKDSAPDDPINEAELIEEENEEEVIDEFIEFSLLDEKVKVNLKMVPILYEYLHTTKNKQEAIDKMNFIPIPTDNSTIIYLLEFSCMDGMCSYLLFDDNKNNQAYLVADLAKHIETKVSPDHKKVLLQFNRTGSLSVPLTNIVVINIDNWEKVTLYPESNQADILNFKWPIPTAEWIDNESIAVFKPDISELTDDFINEWLEVESPTTNITFYIND